MVNGGFLQARATRLNDPIRAKCVVLDDGTSRLAIVVVDSCMMPRELLDRAKALAREKTDVFREHVRHNEGLKGRMADARAKAEAGEHAGALADLSLPSDAGQ